jgi:Peptidase family C25
MSRRRVPAVKLPLAAISFLLAAHAFAGSSITSSLIVHQGAQENTPSGDFIMSTNGMDTVARYFIEVPPGLGRLSVDLFDPDVGQGGAGEVLAQRDRDRGNYDTSVVYSLFDPNGAAQGSLLGDVNGPSDNAWYSFYDSRMPAFRSVATATQTTNTTTLAVPVPAGVVVNDLLILTLSKDGNGAIMTPTGWLVVDEGLCSGNACRFGVYRRFASASEPASYTVSWTNNERAVGAILAYSGVNTTTPLDGFNVATGDNNAPTAPSFATTVPNTRVVRVYGADDDDISGNPYPLGQTGRFNAAAIDTTSGGADTGQAGTGASGAAAFALAAGEQWRAVTLALRPAATAPTPTAGHWELRVDMTDAVNFTANQGNDINAFGIRAHDGTPGAGGTELNVYYDSHSGVGVNPPTSGTTTGTYTYYPYIVSGCTCTQANFDWDASNNSGNQGQLDFASRTGSFSRTFLDAVLSGNDEWATLADGNIPRWTSDSNSTEYGIWRMDASITSYVNGAGQNGNYGNLYLLNYAYAGADPPVPTVNPSPNTFRVYLPTDAGVAPVKPYVEQQLRYGGNGSGNGPNPPVVGQQTIFTVTVRVVNPTAQSITFSASNLVTANVPGAGALYGGGAQVSQGTVTTQPAVGGTGNITWNPGTLAAGATGLLSYRVRITPTSAGQRIPATATPASGNGTRAQFVDLTGNTTQPRATFLFGPLCELAVTQAVLTPVVISRLATRESTEGVVVEWETASEVSAAGFDVYRWDPARKKWLKVNERLVPALVGAPAGGRYQVPDPGASVGERYWYAIGETEVDGPGRFYGPFETGPALDNGPSTESARALAAPRKPGRALLTASALSDAKLMASQKKAAKVVAPALKVGVSHTGLVLLSTQTLAEHFGLAPGAVTAALSAGGFNLTNRGHRVAWLPASGNRGLLFYGEELDSPYARDNVYWLQPANGWVSESVATADPTPNLGGSFLDSVHAEQDAFPATVVTTNPNSDYWFWDYLSAGDPVLGRRSFMVNAPHLVGGGNATLTVNLSSATGSNVKNEHHVIVRLNGVPVTEDSWKGIKAHTLKASVGAGLVHDGANTVELEALLGAKVPLSIVYVDSFDLDYPRAFSATGNALALHADSASSVSVTDFADPGILVLDVSDARRPRLLTNVVVDQLGGQYRASFTPQSPSAAYFAVSESGWQVPAWTEGDQPSSLRAKTTAADYVVITTRELLGPATRLASFRAGSGLTTLVVDIQDVYDEYSDGLQDPRALQSFLKTAAKRWATPPRFVVLAGRGHFDYKNIYGTGGNLVPPLMVSTPKGLFASDTALGDVDGKDGVPEIAVGRIPVLSADEFDAYVDKVEAYESSPAPQTARKALMLADTTDGGTDFGAASDQIAAGLPPGYEAPGVHLQPDVDVLVARAEFFALLDDGADLVNYTGHGALDRLAAAGLLTSDDVPALHNQETPILTALSCTINRFEVPGFAPLGEELVKKPANGFVASWAPTGLSVHGEATQLGKAFYRGLAAAPGATLGETVNSAFKSYIGLGGLEWMPDIYSLLGDPALHLKQGVVIEVPDEGTPSTTTE